jgi:hypothetical protein
LPPEAPAAKIINRLWQDRHSNEQKIQIFPAIYEDKLSLVYL